MSLPKSHLLKQPEVSRFIRELRKLTGLTQEQFGLLVGVSYETISRWENGRMQPSPLALKQIGQTAEELAHSPNDAIRKRAEELLKQYLL